MSITRIFLCLSLGCLVLICAGFWLHDGGAATPAPTFATANQITHDGLAKTAVLSDGSSLYVAEEKSGHQIISKVDPNTGETEAGRPVEQRHPGLPLNRLRDGPLVVLAVEDDRKVAGRGPDK